MQPSTTTVRTLLGALLLSAGLANSLAMGDEPSTEQEAGTEAVHKESDVESSESASTSSQANADMVEVRVSLPDGRTIVRLESKRSMSARYNSRHSSPSSTTSRRLSDGSRISVGSRSVSGGSNSSSARSGGSSGGGGGSSASSSGGGGGGAVSSKSQAGAMQQSGGGVFSYGDGVRANTNNAEQTPRPVPTVGNPSYDREGNASGGQRVEFHDAGMSAAVIGNRVYFIGVELVSANAPFEIITGTRVAEDSVIMDDQRLGSSGSDALSSFDTRNSEIKLEMDSGTVVDLVLFSRSSNPNSPERVQRTWTVRIR